MTCTGCVAKVKSELLKLPDVLNAEVTLPQEAVITMEKHIDTKILQEVISNNGKYTITEDHTDHSHNEMLKAEDQNWLKAYKPLLLIGVFITGVSFLTSWIDNQLNEILWMNHFMAGFFIVFSFFKFLDLKGFAESYATYDLLAKRVNGYGYVYPFIELALGIAYLTAFNPFITNIATVLVMGFSSIGVIQSVLDKKKIQCACLGTVFNLPMSTITIIEDLFMVLMAGTTLLLT